MRNGRLLLLLVISACDSPTEPLFPPGGEYALVAGSEHGYPAAVPEEMLPFDYDVTGDGSCVFRVSAGSLVIDGETYSIDLQQDVVSCTYGWQPMSHEGGRLARYVSSGPSTGWFAFQVTSGQGGWLLDGRYDNGSVYVELAKPEGGRVSYLRFEPAEWPAPTSLRWLAGFKRCDAPPNPTLLLQGKLCGSGPLAWRLALRVNKLRRQ